MKRKYIYITIVFIVAIVLHILTKGHVSSKKQGDDLSLNEEKNTISSVDINLDKASFINLNQKDFENTTNHTKKIENKDIFKETIKLDTKKLNTNEIYSFASLRLTPSRAFLTFQDQNPLKKLNTDAIKKGNKKNSTQKISFQQPQEVNKLFYFQPFNNYSHSYITNKAQIYELSSNENTSKPKKITDIIVINNAYTSSDLLKKRLKTKPGDPINQQKLQSHLNFINLNPFRNVNLILTPKQKNNYNIELITKDQFPFRFYIGTDDMGINVIGRNRSYTGFNLNKAFYIDSILSYQFTTSYEINEFKGHTAQAICYLPWEHVLTLYGDFSQFEPEPTLPYTTIDRRFRIDTSLRYDIHFPLIKNIAQQFILGFDFKRADTNLPYSNAVSRSDPIINISQAMLSYTLSFENKLDQLKFIFEQFFSLSNLFPDQEIEKYDQLRRFAKNNYMYSRAYLSNLFKLPNEFLLSIMLRAQLSNSNLLASEALAIGGYNSVRGYFENELLADQGLIINAEIRSKNFSLIPNKNIKDAFQVILFFDYGLASIYEPVLFEEKNRSIIGYGPGIRYEINPYFAARLDWGIKGSKKPEYGAHDSLLHFSLNFSY